MLQQGMRFARVRFMWTSLMVLTGIGAALGSEFFVEANPHAFAIVEGVAAGAMLTLIAQTMAPEAHLKAGPVVGLATLMGFLAANLLQDPRVADPDPDRIRSSLIRFANPEPRIDSDPDTRHIEPPSGIVGKNRAPASAPQGCCHDELPLKHSDPVKWTWSLTPGQQRDFGSSTNQS